MYNNKTSAFDRLSVAIVINTPLSGRTGLPTNPCPGPYKNVRARLTFGSCTNLNSLSFRCNCNARTRRGCPFFLTLFGCLLVCARAFCCISLTRHETRADSFVEPSHPLWCVGIPYTHYYSLPRARALFFGRPFYLVLLSAFNTQLGKC